MACSLPSEIPKPSDADASDVIELGERAQLPPKDRDFEPEHMEHKELITDAEHSGDFDCSKSKLLGS